MTSEEAVARARSAQKSRLHRDAECGQGKSYVAGRQTCGDGAVVDTVTHRRSGTPATSFRPCALRTSSAISWAERPSTFAAIMSDSGRDDRLRLAAPFGGEIARDIPVRRILGDDEIHGRRRSNGRAVRNPDRGSPAAGNRASSSARRAERDICLTKRLSQAWPDNQIERDQRFHSGLIDDEQPFLGHADGLPRSRLFAGRSFDAAEAMGRIIRAELAHPIGDALDAAKLIGNQERRAIGGIGGRRNLLLRSADRTCGHVRQVAANRHRRDPELQALVRKPPVARVFAAEGGKKLVDIGFLLVLHLAT